MHSISSPRRAPRDGVVFIGIGGSEIVRRSDRDITAFALDAALAAIEDAGLSPNDIDGYVGAPTATQAGSLHIDAADELWGRTFVDSLGLNNLAWMADLHRGFATDMAICAAHALRSEACRYVLGVRALYHLDQVGSPPPRAGGIAQLHTPSGLNAVGARFAARANAYFSRSGAGRRDLFDIVALARRNASRNPIAIWRTTQLTLDEYLASPMITDPLCRFDCDMPVCGAAAFVLTRGDAIPSAARQAAWIKGSSSWQRPEAVFEAAAISPDDITCAQLYDGFSPMLYEFLERFSFCEPDTAWRFVREGHAEPNGRLAVNSFGGSLGEGRLHGMGHVREGILQVSGNAGARQLSRADHCLVQVGPFDSSSCLILGREP